MLWQQLHVMGLLLCMASDVDEFTGQQVSGVVSEQKWSKRFIG